MSDFFLKPNLPDKRVSLAICGTHNQDIINFIKQQGIDIIISDKNEFLKMPVSEHIDLSVHHLGASDILIDKNNTQLYKILSDMGMNVVKTKEEVISPYPHDCSLNCFKAGKYLFCNKNITDESILSRYDGSCIANVKQGYCKCSTLLIDDNCFITDDISIYKKGKELSFDCLLIEKGDVSLDSFEYGFIGGASAKINKNTVIFFGDITKHRSYKEIDLFLKEQNIEYIYSEDFRLTDIGGIIPLK